MSERKKPGSWKRQLMCFTKCLSNVMHEINEIPDEEQSTNSSNKILQMENNDEKQLQPCLSSRQLPEEKFLIQQAEYIVHAQERIAYLEDDNARLYNEITNESRARESMRKIMNIHSEQNDKFLKEIAALKESNRALKAAITRMQSKRKRRRS